MDRKVDAMDEEQGTFKKMKVLTWATGESSDDDVESFISTLKNLSVNHKNVGIMILITFLGLVAVSLMPSSLVTEQGTFVVSLDLTQQRPINVRELLYDTSIRAHDLGSLKTRTISKPIHLFDRGIEFLISYADMTPKAVVSTVDSPIKSLDPVSNPSGSTVASVADPLGQEGRDPFLVVCSVAPKHTLLLNKFNTIQDHALLVTDAFEDQSSPLSGPDLEAWHWTLAQVQGVGFFNSDKLAGASQRHKHMQVIPQDVFWSMRDGQPRHALPVDDVIEPMIEEGLWTASSSSRAVVYELPEFQFRHALVVLPRELMLQLLQEEQEGEHRQEQADLTVLTLTDKLADGLAQQDSGHSNAAGDLTPSKTQTQTQTQTVTTTVPKKSTTTSSQMEETRKSSVTSRAREMRREILQVRFLRLFTLPFSLCLSLFLDYAQRNRYTIQYSASSSNTNSYYLLSLSRFFPPLSLSLVALLLVSENIRQ